MKKEVYQAKELIRSEMDRAHALCSNQLMRLSELFKSEGITITDHHFSKFQEDKSILAHSDDYFSPGYVYSVLYEIAEKDIAKAGISSEKIKNELIRAATTFPVHLFADIQRDIDRAMWKDQFKLTDFTFNDGIPTVSESGKSSIEEKYTASIDNEEEETFIKLFGEFLTSFENLESHCLMNDRRLWLQNIEVDGSWYNRTPEGFKVNMHAFLKQKRNF